MITTLLVSAVLLQAPVAEDPVLRKDRDLNCAEWARTASHYIRLGQEKAITELLDRSGPKPTKYAIRPNHACHIMRLLFDPKPGGSLRQPHLGALPAAPKPSGRWPEYPFVIHAGVIFSFGEDYRLAGLAETPARYAKYLQENGVFRTRGYSVPTGKEAGQALDLLVRSLRWREEFQGSNYAEPRIRQQTNFLS